MMRNAIRSAYLSLFASPRLGVLGFQVACPLVAVGPLVACLLVACPLVVCPLVARAEVGDVLLSTDHPEYPGEGEFQSPLDCVQWATRHANSDHERAIAIFDWLLTHQWHLHSPQEWCQPGRQPGSDRSDYEMVVYDANRGRFSYGFGLCGTVHAWNETYWRAAGFPARRRAFPGHSNSEAFVDGKWRMYDTDMAGVVLKRDGSVATYDDIAGDLSLLDRDQGRLPRYPFAWPSDFEVMKAGWNTVAEGGNWYRLYHGGYAGQPAVVHLRTGESFTRYAHPNAFGDSTKRRFWHQQEGGPHRLWSFANRGRPIHHGPDSNSKGRTRYGNAVFDYAPDLTKPVCFEGIAHRSDNLHATPAGLQAGDHAMATVVFEHFSPYVIAGDPVDDRDPMQNKATDGFVIEGLAEGVARLWVSPDQGQTWHDLGQHSGPFRLDATERVKGWYGWWVKVQLEKTEQLANRTTLRSLRFLTTGQMCETIYPRLKPHGTTVTYRAKARSVVPVLPRLEQEAATIETYEETKLRTNNVEFLGRGVDQRFAYRVRGPKPAQVVFRIPSRTPLVGLSAAARYGVRSPTPEGAEFRLDYSLDRGESWHPLAKAAPPTDNEFSSGWVFGATDFDTPTSRQAWVRVSLDGGGHGTGLLTAELYGLRETSCNSTATVTYSWFDGNDRNEKTFTVPRGRSEFTTTIPTGDRVRDDFVRVEVD